MTESPNPESKELMWQSLDKNGTIISVNDLWLDKMGYTRDEVIGKSFTEFLAPACIKKVQVEFPHLKDYGFVNNVQLELQRKDGVLIEGVLNGISFYEGQEFLKTSCELKTLDYYVDSVSQSKELLSIERLEKNINYLKSEIAKTLVYEEDYDLFIKRLHETLCEPVEILEVDLLDKSGIPVQDADTELQPTKDFSIVPHLIERQKTTGVNVFILSEEDNATLARIHNRPEIVQPSKTTDETSEEDSYTSICSIISNPFGEDDSLITLLCIKGSAAEHQKWLEAIDMISLLISKGLSSLYHAKVQEQTLRELQSAFTEIKTLKGVIPICMHCKGIRDDEGYWYQLEKYISEHSGAQFSHGICEKCMNKLYPDDED